MIHLLLVLSLQAWAGPRTAGSLQTELKDGVFTAKLKDGFHFNEKAPNKITLDGKDQKPVSLTAREALFEGVPKDVKDGRASFYVCDDAVTFCETEIVDLKGKSLTPAPVAKVKDKKKKDGQPNKHGFYEDDYNLALNEAKKNGKLLLIDFSARWCPGCVRFEVETFPTSAFNKLAGDFVKLKLDVDRFENVVFGEKFNIAGIPTLLILNGDQEEITRIVDYQPMDVLEKFFASVKEDPASLRELTEKAQKGKDPQILLRLGRRLLVAGRSAEALEYLKQVKPEPPELLEAEVKTNGKDPKVLEAAIAKEPNSSRSIGWRTQLAEMADKPERKEKIRNEGVAVADALLADKEKMKAAVATDNVGEFTGFEPLMVAMARAELIEASGAPKAEVDAAWKKAADIGTDLKIPATNIGASMRHLIVLMQAKQYMQGDKLAARMLKVDKNNPEIQRRRLRLLVEMRQYDDAIKLGKKVIKNSYGRNEFWAAEVLAKAYIASDRKKEAREFIDSYLSRSELGWPNMKGSRKAFEELKQKVTSG